MVFLCKKALIYTLNHQMRFDDRLILTFFCLIGGLDKLILSRQIHNIQWHNKDRLEFPNVVYDQMYKRLSRTMNNQWSFFPVLGIFNKGEFLGFYR